MSDEAPIDPGNPWDKVREISQQREQQQEQLRVVLAHVEELRAAREEAQQVINRQGADILVMHTEIEHLKAYAKHERSLGAEGPMIELVSARQEIERLTALVNDCPVCRQLNTRAALKNTSREDETR